MSVWTIAWGIVAGIFLFVILCLAAWIILDLLGKAGEGAAKIVLITLFVFGIVLMEIIRAPGRAARKAWESWIRRRRREA